VRQLHALKVSKAGIACPLSIGRTSTRPVLMCGNYTRDLAAQSAAHRGSIKKDPIARTVLARLNEKGEAALREPREVLRRVVELDLACLWPRI